MQFPKFLKVANIPITEFLKVNETTTIKKEFFDYAEDMFTKLLSQSIGFTYEIVTPTDGHLGTRSSNGSWTGLIGMLQRKEADLIIHRVAISNERLAVMNYSYPYVVDRLVFATRKLENTIHHTSFLKPFSVEVWIAFAACLCIMPIMRNVLFHGSCTFRHVAECRLLVHPSLNAAGRRRECCLRMLWIASLTFLRWSYTAVVLSFLTVPLLTGIRTIPELAAEVREGRYWCTAVPGSYTGDILSKSKDDSSIIGKSVRENGNNSNLEAVLRYTSGVKTPAIIDSEINLLPLKESYFVSDDGFVSILMAIGIQKQFCCKHLLDVLVGRIWSAGLYMKFLNDGYHIKTLKLLRQAKVEEYEATGRSLTVSDLKGIFILLGIGCILSLVIFLFELVI